MDAGKAEELESALKQANASLSEERARLQALSQELSRSQEENKTLKSQHDEVVKKVGAAFFIFVVKLVICKMYLI